MNLLRKFAFAGVFFLVAAGFASAQEDIAFGPTSSGFNGGSITFTSNGNGTVDVSLSGLNGAIFSPFAPTNPVFFQVLYDGSFSIANANLDSSPFTFNGESVSGDTTSAFSFTANEVGDFPASPSGVASVSLTGDIVWYTLGGCNPHIFQHVSIGGIMDVASSSGLFSPGVAGGQTVFVNGAPWFPNFLPGQGTTVTLSTDLTNCTQLDNLFDSPAGTTLTTQVNGVNFYTPEPASLVLLGTGLLAFPFVRRSIG